MKNTVFVIVGIVHHETRNILGVRLTMKAALKVKAAAPEYYDSVEIEEHETGWRSRVINALIRIISR